MNDTTQIRHRPDGSIDTAHHTAKGRGCRSESAHEIARSFRSNARGPLFGLATLAWLIPFFGGQG